MIKMEKSKLGKKIVGQLHQIANVLGFKQEVEFAIDGSRIDAVWLMKLPVFGEIPLVGFEIETSWRTRKHIKGDVFNLLTLKSAIGVIMFLREGFETEEEFRGNFEAARRFADAFSGFSKILIWSEDDVSALKEKVAPHSGFLK